MLFIETESACTHNINTDDNNDDYALDENVIKIEGRVRVMVSLNRQSHIVTGYGKFRNITLHDHPASSPKGELKAIVLVLVSTPKEHLASSTRNERHQKK